MKKTNFLIGLVMATMLLCGMSVPAQINSPETFMSAVDAAKSTGGGTITLTGNVGFTTASDSYVLESTADAPLIIEVGTYKLSATGEGISLTIGENVTVNGTGAIVLDALTQGSIIVAGGTIEGSGGRVVSASSGPAFISAGSVTATGTTGNPCAFWSGGQTVTVTGGTITANGNGRCIRTTGTANVSDATFYANDANTNALHCNSGNAVFNISGMLTFYGEGTAIALNGAAPIFIADGTVLDNQMNLPPDGTGKLLSGASANAPVFDYNAPFDIISDTADGTSFPDANGIVNISLDNPNNNEFPGYVGFYYTTDGTTPTANSPFANSTNADVATAAIQITGDPTVIKVRVGRSGVFWDESTVYTFTYHAEGLDPQNPIFNVTNFTQLKDAYEASQADGVVSSTIIIGAAFTITEAFEMTPEVPVTIVNKNSLTTGNNTVLGGELSINIEDNPLMIGGNTTFNGGLVITGTITGSANIRTSGSPVLTINGGEYTTTGNGNLFQMSSANAKIIVNDGTLSADGNATLIQLSNATASAEIEGGVFTVNGTGSSAKAFHVSSGGAQVTISDGTITVGGGGRGIHLASAGTVKINGGSITMNGTNTGSQIIRIDNNNMNSVEINGGTFSLGRGNLINFAGNQNSATCVVRAADVDLAGGVLYVKNGPGDGSPRPEPQTGNYGTQKIYDFRGFIITPSVEPAPITEPVTVELSLPATITPDPVDAAGAEIYYSLQEPVVYLIPSLNLLYSEPVSIVPNTSLCTVLKKDGFTSSVIFFIYSQLMGIDIPSIDEAKAYIADNTLYLPESGAVQVFNVGGQLVLNVLVTDATLDVSSLSKGIYIVKSGAATFKVVK